MHDTQFLLVIKIAASKRKSTDKISNRRYFVILSILYKYHVYLDRMGSIFINLIASTHL